LQFKSFAHGKSAEDILIVRNRNERIVKGFLAGLHAYILLYITLIKPISSATVTI